jgi:N-acetylglucosamine-6-phosphate deacetylase
VKAFHNARMLLADGWRDDACVVVEGDRIAAILSDAPAGADVIDLGGATLLPGFIDVQVNGGGGLLFNDDPSVETIRVIAETHRRYGSTGLLPTLISDDLSVVEAGIRAVDAAIAAGVPGVLGIHIEGPFLNPVRRGIHSEGKIQPLAGPVPGAAGIVHARQDAGDAGARGGDARAGGAAGGGGRDRIGRPFRCAL